MNLSLGEYEALVAKALKGAGYPWGLAGDGAWAARELARFEPRSPIIVSGLCELADGTSLGMPNADWAAPGEFLCPVCVGTAIFDSGTVPMTPIGPVAAAELIAPFVAELADDFDMVSPAGRIEVRGQGLEVTGEWAPIVTSLTTERTPSDLSAAATNVARPRTRVDVDVEELATLKRFAHRTYAPATEESRRAGAGES